MAIVDKEQRKSAVIPPPPLEDDVRRMIKKYVALKLVEGGHVKKREKKSGKSSKTPDSESE
jgi:hypothetical protein